MKQTDLFFRLLLLFGNWKWTSNSRRLLSCIFAARGSSCTESNMLHVCFLCSLEKLMMGIRRSVHQLELGHPRLPALVSMLSPFLWKTEKHTREKKRSTLKACRRRKKKKIKCVVRDNDVDLSAGWRRFPHSWCQQTYNKCKKWAELQNTLNRPFFFNPDKVLFCFPLSPCVVGTIISSVVGSSTETEGKDGQIGFKSESQSLIWVLLRGLTVLNDQLDVDLVVIEPARDLHPAAVLATIAPPSV